MAVHRTRKNKESPHYNFLVSWSPTQKVSDPEGSYSQPHVKRESVELDSPLTPRLSASKMADIQAKEDSFVRIKKDIIHSLILVSFVLVAEVVVYLARNKFNLP